MKSNKVKRVYISGRMSGLAQEEYEQNFYASEERIRIYKVKVFNPVRWGWLLRHLPYKWCLIFDFIMLCFCDTIWLQKNWRESKGAKAEKAFADALNLYEYYE